MNYTKINMKLQDLKIGQILKESRFEVEVLSVTKDSFEVQYISGACYTYNQSDLDNNKLESFIR